MNIQRICTVACYIWYFHHYNYHLYNLLSQKAVTYDTAFLQKAIWVYVFLHKVTDISTPLSPELIMSTVQFISDLCKIYAFVWKLRFQFYLSEMLETYSVSTLQCLINGGDPNSKGHGKNIENFISGAAQISQWDWKNNI